MVISPHFDDAVLSAGQFLAGRPNADVLTVFGGKPTPPVVEWRYDQSRGFKSPDEAVDARRAEDKAALDTLQANQIVLDYPDGQYQEATDAQAIANDIKRQVELEDYEFIVGPLGLAHPDHEKVSHALAMVADQLGKPVYFYEDIPARVLYPEKVRTIAMSLEFIGDGPIETKITALECYKSQWGFDVLNERYCLVPERFWKL